MDMDFLDLSMTNKKTLILMRHGEKLETQSCDYERPLSEKGERQSRFVANQFNIRGIKPELVLYSGSPRTKQTAEQFESQFSHSFDRIDSGQELYRAASEDAMMTVMAKYIPDTAQNVLVVGHNPGICLLVHYLARNAPPQMLAALQNNYPSSTACLFEISAEHWWEIEPHNCSLSFITSGDGLIVNRPVHIPSRTI